MSEKPNIVLPKWPFLIGDLILVLLACFIVISSPKPMSGIGIFASTLSVLLGMLVYITPYIIEHLTQQQRIKLKQAKAEETLLKAVELASDLLNRTESIHAELMKGVLGVRQVPAKLEQITEELVEIMESETLVSSVTELTDTLNQIETKSASNSESSPEKLTKNQIDEIVGALSPVELSDLLKTSDAIQSSIEELRNEILEKLEAIEAQRIEPASDNPMDVEPAQHTAENKAVEESNNDEPVVEANEISEEIDESSTVEEDNLLEKENPKRTDESLNETVIDTDFGENADLGVDNPEMLIEEENLNINDEDVAIRHNEDGATRLIVGAFIGISNKLFIRGEGPGLDWDKGIPMELVGIGKWEWKTYDANAPVQCKVLINDEQWTDSENITIEPNTTLETTASF